MVLAYHSGTNFSRCPLAWLTVRFRAVCGKALVRLW